MSQCLAIRIKQRPNYLICERYRIDAMSNGPWAGVLVQVCGTDTPGEVIIQQGRAEEFCVQPGSVPTKNSGEANIMVTPLGECTNETSGNSLDDGTLFLDLFPGFNMRQTKQVTELTEANKIKFDFVLGFDVPNTPHNMSLLKTFFNPNVQDNEYNDIAVDVISGSHILNNNELYVKKCTADRISVELRLAVDHWGRLAKDCKLCDLEYADVDYSCTLIRDVIENQYPYDFDNPNFTDPSNLGIWFPAVDYGRLIRDRLSGVSRASNIIIPLEYWRPWYYISGILKRGFCRLGWGFKSPFFEAEAGRKLITYIQNRNYGLSGDTYIDRRNDLNFRGEVETSYLMGFPYSDGSTGPVIFPEIIYDPVTNYDVTNGAYSAGGEINIRGLVKFEVGEDDVQIKISIIKIDNYLLDITPPPPLAFNPIESQQFDSASGVNEYEFELENISLTSQQSIMILVDKNPASTFVAITDESYLEIEGVRPYFIEGETESLRNLIDCDYDFLTFLKGLSHLFNLKFVTDFADRTVRIYTPYDAEIWGEDIEGFWIEETVEDITAKINPKSKTATTPNIETARIQNLTFKDSTDKYIEGLDLPAPLWSREVDLGEKFTIDKKQDRKNPFFEPTANRIGLFRNTFAVHVPILQGENEVSWSQGPRIAIAHGNVSQEFDNEFRPQLRYCTWDDDASELIPTASQWTPIKIGTTHNVEGDVAVPECDIIYKVNPGVFGSYGKATTLYHIVYRRWLLEQLNNLSIQYLVDLNQMDFLDIDFRKYYCFQHMGRLVTARMQKINDYHFCKNILTPVDFIPQKQISNLCGILPDNNGGDDDDDGPPPPFECQNNPVIFCQFDGLCYLLTLGGTNNAPILNTIWEYRLATDTVWNTIPNITTISAEICGITEEVFVRVTVIYDTIEDVTCPAVMTSEKLLKPCPTYPLEIECIGLSIISNGVVTDAVKAVIDLPVTTATVTVVDAFVSIDEGPPVAYPTTVTELSINGDPIIAENVIDFEITVQFDNCPPVTLTKRCDVPGAPTGDCDDINVSLSVVDSDTEGCYTFERSGVVPFVYDSYIKYKCSDDGGETFGPWLLWDEITPVCCDFVTAKWYIHFCDDACPMLCVCADCDVSVEITSSTVTCLHTMSFENPIDGTDTVNIIIPDNSTRVIGQVRCIVTGCDGAIVSDEIVERDRPSPFMTNLDIFYQSGVGFAKSVKVRDNLGGIFTIPLSPTTATLTGVAGTVIASDLIYNAANITAYSLALRTVIINFLDSMGYTETDNYILTTGAQQIASGGIIRITFRTKNTPVGAWVGFENGDLALVGCRDGINETTNTGASNQYQGATFGCNYCNGSIGLGTPSIQITNGALTTYNNIIPVDPIPIEYLNDPTTDGLCASTILTATVTGCTGEITYEWSTGATTESIPTPVDGGAVVFVSCGGCQADTCDLGVDIVQELKQCTLELIGSNFRAEGIPGTATATLTHDCQLKTTCDGEELLGEPYEVQEVVDYSARANGYSFTNMQTGGYIDHIRLTAVTPDDCFDVDLNPCTVFASYPAIAGMFTPDANGCASELFFDSANNTGFASALITVINEAIRLWEISNALPAGSAEYYLSVDFLAADFAVINFGTIHEPAGTLIGVSNAGTCGDYSFSRDGVAVINSNLVASRTPRLEYRCESLDYCGFLRSYFYNQSGITAWPGFRGIMDNFTFADPVAPEETGTPITAICETPVLTANAVGGFGEITYEWSTGETTESIADPGTRPISVTITRDGCTAENEIIN